MPRARPVTDAATEGATMTADEIRSMRDSIGGAVSAEFWLSEIAAQLAELNAQLKRWDTSAGDDGSCISVATDD